jgi:predicted kinase
MKTLILTIGLPRSGKSTWAKKTGFPIVNRDAIRLALHGQPFILEAEPMVTAIEDYMVKSLFLAGNKVVIVDATHMKRKYIERWIKEDWETKVKIFDTPKEECIQRAYRTDKSYLIPIIEKMTEERDF